jgi:predicted transcriptional regulator
MEVLWEVQEATVHDILARLAQSKPLAYTSVLSCLQKLEKVGWVTHRAEDRTYYYRPVKSRDGACRRSLLRLLDDVFGGNHSRLLQQLLEDDRLTDEDLAQLQNLIKQRRAEEGQ